ncbi:uncharacterized protein [Nicotiana sylvestris]|uniref:uncharacterized protein n=1 Tax=Nicotiana sylvestris TaxID=4096 RepID=UPI00388CA6E1
MEADRVSIQLMIQAFNHFSDVYGLKANLDKSSLYIAGISQDLKQQILNEIQFAPGELPFKYLGVLLSSKKITVQQCMPIVEKMISRIRCWTTNSYLIVEGAAICKLLWAVSTRKESLWVQLIHGYYIKNKEIESMKIPIQACWLVRKIFDARNWFDNRNYKVELGKCSKGDKFSIKTAYLSFQPQYQKVHRKNLTMEARQIPRHQFILWLAIRQRLAAVDRLERWGINVPKDCVFCSKGTTESLALSVL